MQNGRFTSEERKRISALVAVERVTATQIIYSKQFKVECMARYHAGESPSAIFASVGLPSSLIGYKRIERAIYHWKEAERKDALILTDASCIKHDNFILRKKIEKEKQLDQIRKRRDEQVESLKQEKRAAVARQRAIRDRRVGELEEKLKKQKEKAKSREEQIIASQAAQIKALKAQVKALKANGTLARRTKRTPFATNKSERFELISQLRIKDPAFDVKAACIALEVSRSGYYEWCKAAHKREKREQADLIACEQISQALAYRGVRKGSREIKQCMLRTQNIIMNRKKILRISKKYDLIPKPKRKHPYHPIGTDGLPKVADNVVNRNFRRGEPLKVISTDITYLPSKSGFSYLSGIIDCETDVVLAHVTSTSMEEKFVLDTYDQLKGLDLPKDIFACSDQGVHYTAQAYREKLAELGINQSMSRKACCWDNAPIESFWSRLKFAIGSTDNLTHTEIVKRIDDFIDYYNNERGQARLGWLAPKEYAQKLTA